MSPSSGALRFAAAFCILDRRMRQPPLGELNDAVALVLSNPYVRGAGELGMAQQCLRDAVQNVPALVSTLASSKAEREARKLLYAVGHLWAQGRPDEQPALPELIKEHAASLRKADLDVGGLRSLLSALRRFYQAIRLFVGRSDSADRVRAEAWSLCFGASVRDTLTVAKTIRGINVLILGETGTGKEVIAQAIQAGALGAETGEPPPRQALNAATLTPELAGSELFGHERGAFTGASTSKRGRIEEVDGGTLFLDEVGELPVSVRGQLLRVMSTGELSPVGSSRVVQISVRYISATRRPLLEMSQREEFPRDLYARLAGSTITIPPLRERPEDIPTIARALMANRRAAEAEITTVGTMLRKMVDQWLGDEACSMPWHGNVRELDSEISQRLLGFPRSERRAELSPRRAELSPRRAESPPVPPQVPAEIAQGAATEEALLDWYRTKVIAAAGNLRIAAQRLSVSEDTLQRWRRDKKKK